MSQPIPQLFVWKTEKDQFSKWKCLHKEYPRDQTYGCEFNTIAYLKSLPRDIAEYLTRQTNAKDKKSPASKGTVLGLLRDYFPNRYEDTLYHWDFVDLPINQYTWMHILEHLPNHHATFLWLVRKEPNPNHAVVLQNTDNQLTIIDPQQEKIRKFGGLEVWFSRMGVVSLRFLVAKPTQKRPYPKDAPIRKKVSPPTKKRRLDSQKSSFGIPDVLFQLGTRSRTTKNKK
jgi:hypothetical protein